MNDALIEAIKKACDPDKTWTTNAMAQLTIRRKGGEYRKTAVAPGDPPMFLTGVRPGKKADIIFEFEPVDVRPYEGIEMTEKQVFGLLPGFERHVTTAMGYPPITTLVDELAIEQEISFTKARALFKRDEEARAKATKLAAEKAHLAEIDAASKTEAERYSDNQLWGAFA